MSPLAVRTLGSADEPALRRFLRPRTETSMILLNNLAEKGVVDDGQPFSGAYAAAFEHGEVIAVAAHYWNGKLVLQAPQALADVCAAALASSGRPLTGALGPEPQVLEALRALDIDDADLLILDREILFTLDLRDLVPPKPLVVGALRGRRIRPRDMDLAIDWLAAYYVELAREADGPELRARCRELIDASLRQGRSWLLEADGATVSISSFNAVSEDTVQIGGVWTPPELRGRGYARAAVAASLLDVRAEFARRAILFTGDDNRPAQRAYAALGFRPIGRYCIALLQPPRAQPGAGG